MRRVLQAKLQDIERAELAGKRGGSTRPLSLEQSILSDDTGAGLTLADLLPDPDPEVNPQEALRRTDLRRHVERVLRQLPERQQALADGLRSGRSVSELSRSFRVPRGTLYEELRRIRDVFQDNGLEEYLH